MDEEQLHPSGDGRRDRDQNQGDKGDVGRVEVAAAEQDRDDRTGEEISPTAAALPTAAAATIARIGRDRRPLPAASSLQMVRATCNPPASSNDSSAAVRRIA